MFNKIFEKLGSDYIKEKELIYNGDLYEAFSLVKEKEDKEAKLLEGIIYILYKKYKKAFDIFKYLVKENDEKIISNSMLYEFLGLCCYERNNHLDAIEYYLKSLKENENNFYSRYNLSNIYIKKKKYEKAYENLKILEKMRPENENIKQNIEAIEKNLDI